MRTLLVWFTVAAAAWGQYKLESAGGAPVDLKADVSALLQADGAKVANNKGPLFDVWLVSKLPSGKPTDLKNITLPEVPHGALLGAIRVHQKVSDRRGNMMKPGLYLMRYSYIPDNGAHQGASPQRDFVVLTDPSGDTDVKATPDFNTLMGWATKASGLPHPLVLSLSKLEDPFKGGFAQSEMHESDWILQAKIGDTPVALVLVGIAEQ